MVLNKDEFMSRIKASIGEDMSDDNVRFIEDMSDTYDDLASRTVDTSAEWEEKYNKLSAEKDELDKTWREKYTSRFFDGETTPDEVKKDQEENVIRDGEETTFEDLFEEREG